MPDGRLIDDTFERFEFLEISLHADAAATATDASTLSSASVFFWLFLLLFKAQLIVLTDIVVVCDACVKPNWLLKWLITFHVLLWLDAGDDDDDDGNDDINGKRNKKLIVEAVAVVVVVLICFECCLTKLIGLISCLYWINERRMHEDSDWTKDRKKLSEKKRKQKEKESLKLKRTEKKKWEPARNF